MNPILIMTVVIAVVMFKRLADMYTGGEYVCPSCGTRSEGRHSPDCPWSRPPSE
jgi:rubrerythrin